MSVRIALVALEALIAVTAVWGALGILPTSPRAWLHQGIIAPFADYTIPALALGVLCGGSAAIALAAVVTSPRLGALASAICGVVMIAFELVEIAVVGFTPVLEPRQPVAWLQVFYLVVGAALVVLGAALWKAVTGSYTLAGLVGMREGSHVTPTLGSQPETGANQLPQLATWLSLLILALMPLAAGIGVFVPGFYRDTAWTIPQARGQDLVTLYVAEPLLVAAVVAASRGSLVGRLLWAGALGYVLYTYALFSYTAYFNPLFLVYVALFSASLFALIDLLAHLDLAPLRQAIHPTLPVRPIAGFLAFVGVFFLLAWLAQIVPATLQGTAPASIIQAQTPSNGVFVQDLGVVIPLCFVAAVWLWRRQAWGNVLAAVLLVLSTLIAVALVAMALFSAQAQIAGALDMLWGFVVLALISVGCTALLALALHPVDRAAPAA